jgi:replication factor A1
MGLQEKPDYISVKGTITFIRHDTDPWYTACPVPGCNKKVTPSMGEVGWHCEKCNKVHESVSSAAIAKVYFTSGVRAANV